MDVRALNYFIALEECGHYSSAAKRVHISPQGLSSAIKRLEGELGVPLFDARSGTVVPTDYGKAFSEYAHKAVAEGDAVVSRISKMQRCRSGEISLLSSVGLISVFPDDFIDEFNKGNACGAFVPEVRALPDVECDQWLENGLCDFALMNKPIDFKMFCAEPLYDDNMFVWVNKENPMSQKDGVRVEELSGQRLVELATDYKQSRNNEKALRERAKGYSILHVNEMIQILDHVIRDGYVGLTVQPHAGIVRDPRVVALPIIDLKWGFSLCWQADRVLSEADKALIGYFAHYHIARCA